MKTTILVALVLASSIAVVASAHISKWERDNHYPYGKMCNSIFTGFVDTCRRKPIGETRFAAFCNRDSNWVHQPRICP